MIHFLVLSIVAGVVEGNAVALDNPPTPEIVVRAPVRGARIGEIVVGVDYKNAPGAASVDITLFTSIRCFGIPFPASIASTSGQVGLPKGAWGDNIARLPSGVVITRAAAELKDKDGMVIIGNRVDNLKVVVP